MRWNGVRPLIKAERRSLSAHVDMKFHHSRPWWQLTCWSCCKSLDRGHNLNRKPEEKQSKASEIDEMIDFSPSIGFLSISNNIQIINSLSRQQPEKIN